MKIKYIEESIPEKYFLTAHQDKSGQTLQKERQYESRTYKLLGPAEKQFSFRHRMWVFGRSLLKTIFSLGILLKNERLRDDWKSCLRGKRVVVLYSTSEAFILKIKADKGDSQAQYEYALYCEGDEKGNKVAMEYYKEAAKQGHTDACNNLGMLYVESGNLEEAMKWFTTAAEKNSPVGQYNLARYYFFGNSVVEKNVEQAVDYYKKSAAGGCAFAQLRLGHLYEGDCEEVKQDVEASKKYFKDAAENTSANEEVKREALDALGLLSEKEGSPANA